MLRACRSCAAALIAAALLASPVSAAHESLPPTGQLVEGVACRADPSQTYTLYLPSRYSPKRKWPALLVLDPRGRGTLAAELFREPAEAYGWIILSSNNTRSDGPMEPNNRALKALWPELGHYAVDPDRVYAAGFSGTAIVAWALGEVTDHLAGVIAAGGRWEADAFRKKPTYASFGTVGNIDFNYSEMRRVDRYFAEQGIPHRLEIFDGPHRWMPPELAREAVEWMELQAMRQGRRPRDEALAARLYADDVAAARELEDGGEGLAALRRYRAIVETYQGLVDTGRAKARVAALAASRAVARAEKEEQRWNRFERSYIAGFVGTLARFRSADSPALAPKLLHDLRVAELQERALAPGYQGVVARRLLEKVFTHTSFYLMREFFAAQDYARAAAVLEVAVAIKDDRPGVWYNLACARARTGSPRQALEALSRAVDEGYHDLGHLEADPDLASLRKDPQYREIVVRLETAEEGAGAEGDPPRDDR